MSEYLSKEELEDYFGREYLTIYEMFGFGPDDYIQHWYKDEIWTPIIGFEDYYISNKGRVWNERYQRMLRHTKGSANGRYHNGYWRVNLWVNNKPCTLGIHRLVAIHFIPNPNDYPVVGHIDDNKDNNYIRNLEWCTYYQNAYRAAENGSREPLDMPITPCRPVISINTDTGEQRYHTSITSLAHYLNLSNNHPGHIPRAIRTGYKVKGHRVYDASEFNLPPGLQDGDIVELEVPYEN